MIEVDDVFPAQQDERFFVTFGENHFANWSFHRLSTSLLVSEGSNGIAIKHLHFGFFSRNCSTLNLYAVMTCTQRASKTMAREKSHPILLFPLRHVIQLTPLTAE